MSFLHWLVTTVTFGRLFNIYMKKLLLSFGLIFSLSIAVSAQSSKENSTTDQQQDSTSNEDLGKRQDLFFIDLNWDYLFGMPSTVNQKYWGRGVSLGLMFDQPLNETNNISLAIGAGFQTHNYYTDGVVRNYDTTSVTESVWFNPDASEKVKGKISLNYVDVPFEVRFRSNPNEKGFRWKFAVGGKVGYLIQAHEKTINDQDIKVKYYNYPTINTIRYGVTARVGYGSVMLSSFYSLSNMFNQNHLNDNPTAFSVGISLVPF